MSTTTEKPCLCEDRFACTCTPEQIATFEQITATPTVICSWCKTVISHGTAFAGLESHGICEKCAPRVREESGLSPVPTRPEIKTPLTYHDADGLVDEALNFGEHFSTVLIRDRLVKALMFVDVASRKQAEEPLIACLAYLGMRADEQGDIHARNVAARAIAEARGEILPAASYEPSFLDSKGRKEAIDKADGK